jgi:alpha-L-rhamnosidase
MKPTLIEGLSYVKASYKSVYGVIRSEWKVTNKEFEWNLCIPANTTATVFIPAKNKPVIREAGEVFNYSDSLNKNGIVKVDLSSGVYQVISRLK